MFKTQDVYAEFAKNLAAFPKTPEDFKTVFEKSKNVYTSEAQKVASAMKTFQKAATGDASVNEIAAANKDAMSVAKTVRFAAFMSVPGAIFMVPTLAKMHAEMGVNDFVPESVKKEFDLQ